MRNSDELQFIIHTHTYVCIYIILLFIFFTVIELYSISSSDKEGREFHLIQELKLFHDWFWTYFGSIDLHMEV